MPDEFTFSKTCDIIHGFTRSGENKEAFMKCAVCGVDQWQVHLGILKKCGGCGFVRADDSYFDIDPAEIYTNAYFNTSDYLNYTQEQRALQVNFADRLKRIRRHKENGELLEIGCAHGYFLALAEEHFSTTGIDLSHEITDIAKANTSSANILTRDFLDASFEEESFDVVCMLDTIEHLIQPDEYIAKIHKVLKPGGILVIETGDIGAILPRIRGRRWRLITPPLHLHYFSSATLARLLEKHGFSIVESSHVAFARTANQILYKTGRSKRIRALLSFIGDRVFTLNTYDLVFMIGQKS